MKEKLKKLLAGLLGSGIMVLLLFGTFAVVALVGGNVMRLFGFHYESVGQLLLYFLLGELLGLPLDLFSTALPKALYHMGKGKSPAGKFPLHPYGCLIYHGRLFWLADRWMDSVSTTGLSLCILGFGTAWPPCPSRRKTERKGERTMGFWLFCTVCGLLIPAVMLFFGQRFLNKPPKKINSLYGYRTSRSMKNQQTWDCAHQVCGKIWFRVGVATLPQACWPCCLFWDRI